MDLTTSSPAAPFSTMKQDMPRCGGSAAVSVRASRAKVLPSRPLVTNIFEPVMR